MSRNVFAVTGVAVLLGLTLACTSKSSTPLTPENPSTGGSVGAASDGSTLKVTAPVPQSPINDQKPVTGPARLSVSASTAPYVPVIAVNYRFQIFNSANVMVENNVINSTVYDVQSDLATNARYTWRARAEGIDVWGPWSTTASFVAPESAFLGVDTFADPLTNGRTVGMRQGGHFVGNQGWMSDSTTDGIDYQLQSACTSCVLEFDVTNFGRAEGEPLAKDLKWITMGDGSVFGDFGAFRNHPWKMHLEQRSDGNGTGMKVTWRNGGFDEGIVGDHVIKVDPAVSWSSSTIYHFKFEWDSGGFGIYVNGEQWFGESFGGFGYNPPNHRISLGCYPRSESFPGAIYKNVKLRHL
jgi:hypothetical protein